MEQQIIELLDSVHECLAIVIQDSSDIARDFQAGNTGRANTQLIEYIENVTCLVNALDTLGAKQPNIVAKVEINALQNVLVEMEQAMRSQDYVLLADILQYEIKEELTQIQEAL